MPPRRHFTNPGKTTADEDEEDGFSRLLGGKLVAPATRPIQVEKPFQAQTNPQQQQQLQEQHVRDLWILQVRGIPPHVARSDFVELYVNPLLTDPSGPIVRSSPVNVEFVTSGDDDGLSHIEVVAFVHAYNRVFADLFQDAWDGEYAGYGYWMQVSRITRIELEEFKTNNEYMGPRPAGKVERQGLGLNDRRLVNRMVQRVIEHGHEFEARVMQREALNPRFAFLFPCTVTGSTGGSVGALAAAMHLQYLATLYIVLYKQCYVQAVSLVVEPTTSERRQLHPHPPHAFQICKDPDLFCWLPSSFDPALKVRGYSHTMSYPPPADLSLGQLECTHLLLLLQHTTTLRRGGIARVSGFILDQLQGAGGGVGREIVGLVCGSIEHAAVQGNSVAALSRVYVVSDVLHNTLVLGRGNGSEGADIVAGLFLDRFERRTLKILKQASALKLKLNQVLSVWQSWGILGNRLIQVLKTDGWEFEYKSPELPSVGVDSIKQTTRAGQPEPDQEVDGVEISYDDLMHYETLCSKTLSYI